MSCVLTRGDYPIVAVLTSICGLVVIDVDGLPIIRSMAGFAQVAGDRMAAAFTRCHGAIVAALTGVAGLAVVDGV